MLLEDFTDYFDRAPRGAALETLQKFGVRSGTPFSSYLRAFRVVAASTVEKGGPLAPSAEMAIELVRIRTTQQYPMLMPTLFPGELATRRPYCTLASVWTAFANLKHITTPVINGDESTSASQALSSQAPTPKIPSALSGLQMRCSGRPLAQHVNTVSNIHSRHDPFAADYGLWLFDDTDYDICLLYTSPSPRDA